MMALPPLLTPTTSSTARMPTPIWAASRTSATALSRLDIVMALLSSLVVWPLPEAPM
jgi:hypothetical protein